MVQLQLTNKARRRSIRERFIDFHYDNPEVYQEIVKIARVHAGQGNTQDGHCPHL